MSTMIDQRFSRKKFVFLCLAFALLLCMYTCYALLLPEASGILVFQSNGTTIDASHADQGYIMVRQDPTNKPLKLRLSYGKNTLTYDLNSEGEFEVFPLQMGSGKYSVQIFAQAKGKKFSNVSSTKFDATLESDLTPYLYPNQYVNYNAESPVVQKADELCAGLTTEREKVDAIINFVTTTMVYDYQKAATVTTGYLPCPDNTLFEKTGICFDFSSMIAAMLRSQGIPTQLTIGYADRTYHAWNTIYVDGQWTIIDATATICNTFVSRYTVERFY